MFKDSRHPFFGELYRNMVTEGIDFPRNPDVDVPANISAAGAAPANRQSVVLEHCGVSSPCFTSFYFTGSVNISADMCFVNISADTCFQIHLSRRLLQLQLLPLWLGLEELGLWQLALA